MKFLKIFTLFFFLLFNYAFAQQTIKDLTVNDLKVVNVLNGSKPCPLMTETQRNAIASPQNGRCIYNTTYLKLNIYNGSIWKSASGGIDTWVTSFGYAVNDLVIESSKIYQCQTAHTSGTFATDLAALKWAEVSAAGNLTGAVTSTGLATSLGSFTSANLSTALTNETGSGVAVFATSPTLVTPVIGAATGTSLSVSGQLTSTVATGTAPLAITSTTKVNNLHVARATLGDTVTTNANLTGPITSTGNATSVAAQTGTGTTFVMNTSPTLVTPVLGIATATSVNGTTIPTSKTLVVTTDKLSVHAATTSSELAGVISDETGSGALAFATSPTLVTPNIGAATGASLSVSGQLISTVATGTAPMAITSTTKVNNLHVARATLGDTVTTNANLTGPITSVGNATSIASQTGTGSKFVMDKSPTLVTPALGVASATSLVAGGTINANAVLDIQSTTKASMPFPRMTTTQKNAITSPTAGMVVYDTTIGGQSTYNGTAWQTNSGSSVNITPGATRTTVDFSFYYHYDDGDCVTYCDIFQIGTVVASISQSTPGDHVVTLDRSYLSIICDGSVISGTSTPSVLKPIAYGGAGATTIQIKTYISVTASASHGSIHCKATY